MSSSPKLEYLEKQKACIIQLLESGYTQTEIHTMLKVSDATLRKFLIHHNIDRRKPNEVKKLIDARNYKDIPESDITNTYNSGFSITQTARKYRIAVDRVSSILRKHDIIRKSRKVILVDDIKALYYDQKLPMNRVANLLKISGGKLIGLFKKYNLHVRDDAYLRKKYVLPSGKNIFIQGYEPQFLDFLFSNKILDENELCFDRIVISYADENGVTRRYFPDFYIPKYNLIVEIKSSWILKIQKESRVKCKEVGTRLAGYNFHMILNNNFDAFVNCINSICADTERP